MRILYLVKSDPTRSLGHAADRAREFIKGWREQGLSLTTAWPGPESLNTKKTWIEKIMGVHRSHHFRQMGQTAIKRLRNMVHEQQPDWIVCEELTMAHLAVSAGFGKRSVYIAHNIESLLFRQIEKNSSLLRQLRAADLEKEEERIVNSCRAVFAFSSLDADRLSKRFGRKDILSTRAGVHIPPYKAPQGDCLLFVGALDYAPNIEGLHWFIQNIRPKIKVQLRLLVVGRNPGRLVRELCSQPNIELVANPAEISPFLEKGLIEVVPLLSGSGTRGKILEAAAHGLPLVSTTLGAEGLNFPPSAITLTDDEVSFAREVDSLAQNSERALKQSEAAYAYVQNFDYQKVIQDLTTQLKRLR